MYCLIPSRMKPQSASFVAAVGALSSQPGSKGVHSRVRCRLPTRRRHQLQHRCSAQAAWQARRSQVGDLECEATYAKVSGPDHSATTDAAGQVRNCDEESAAKAKEVTRNLEIERSRAASEATAGAGFRFTALGHAGRKMINGRRPRARDGTRAGRGAFASLSSHIDSW